jgi:hypothetical protein
MANEEYAQITGSDGAPLNPTMEDQASPPNPILAAAGQSVLTLIEPAIQTISLTVIAMLQKQAIGHANADVILPFLNEAYEAVKAGGGQEGGEGSQAGPQDEKPLN